MKKYAGIFFVLSFLALFACQQPEFRVKILSNNNVLSATAHKVEAPQFRVGDTVTLSATDERHLIGSDLYWKVSNFGAIFKNDTVISAQNMNGKTVLVYYLKGVIEKK